MKNIFITGAGGFIGSHLAEECVRRGMRVKAFVRYNSNNTYGWLDKSDLAKDMEIVAGDVRDFDLVTRSIRGCDTVLHLAALIGIPYSYISPLAYIRTNVEGTYNILEASRNFGTERIVIMSTSETYGTAQYVPIDEKHPTVGQSPYAASKAGADQLAISYHRSFGMPVKIARPFNTYGPRQSARAIIPTIISQALKKETIRLGNLTPKRDFTFVKDTVNGILAIAQADDLIGEAANIGTNTEITIEDLAKTIGELLGQNLLIQEEDVRVRPTESEVHHLVCDNEKLVKHTGWQPAYSLEEGLKETIRFIEDNQHEYKAEIYNV